MLGRALNIFATRERSDLSYGNGAEIELRNTLTIDLRKRLTYIQEIYFFLYLCR